MVIKLLQRLSVLTKKAIISVLLLICCFIILAGCDPIYPPGKLKVAELETLAHGSAIAIEIIYPNTGGSIVLGWKNQNIEIVSGKEIIAVSDLSITGLKPGTARIKVSSTTVISDDAASEGKEEKVYSTEIDIKVE